mgnify:CR=1 FL=1
MKKILCFLLLFNYNPVLAENSIIAIVNKNIITYNSIENLILNANTKEDKIKIVSKKIDNILQLKKIEELNLQASPNDINLALLEISNINNISIDQLSAYPEFLSLKNEVAEKISILNLQRYITKGVAIDENEAINICSKKTSEITKQIKIAQIIISEMEVEKQKDKDIAIKAFLNKLSNHISKGASFKGLAKLHSQHSSYFNGGITDWIEVNNPTIKMLDSLNDSEVSEIYLTDLGFAIGIKLEERFISNNLKKCKEELIYLTAEKFYSSWVKELRDKAYIKIYHDAL